MPDETPPPADDAAREPRQRPEQHEHDVLFTAPVPPGFPPPGFPPPGPHVGRVVYFKHELDDGGDGERPHEDLMLRKVPAPVARRFRAAAGGRALTHGQYLTALVELHERLRGRADAGDATASADLDALGLQSVTV
jgi:hypothetical protein